jgi:hypothetical protein
LFIKRENQPLASNSIGVFQRNRTPADVPSQFVEHYRDSDSEAFRGLSEGILSDGTIPVMVMIDDTLREKKTPWMNPSLPAASRLISF